MPPETFKMISALFSRPAPPVLTQAPQEPNSKERRVQPRFTTQFRSTFSGTSEEGQGHTLDISAGGCKIESDMKVKLGATFECRLYVPGFDWPLRIDEAKVQWIEGGTFGLAFTCIRPEEVSKLQTMLAELDHEE